MKASDLFGVVVRSFGLTSVYYGAWYLLYALLYRADALSPEYPDEMKAYFASGLAFLLGGAFMMRGAEWFVRFCYPPAVVDPESGNATPDPPSS